MILDSALPERIESKIKRTENSCWEWQATKTLGYGMVRFNGRMRGAHRVVYELLKAKIPKGLHIDHLCRNPACVNPDHLEPVTCKENIRRGLAGKVNNHHAKKTTCPKGHPYDKSNTYIVPTSGGRLCRACRRVSNLEAYYRRKARQCS